MKSVRVCGHSLKVCWGSGIGKSTNTSVSENKRRCHENVCLWVCAREPSKRHSRSLSGAPLSCLPNKSSCGSCDHRRSPV